MIYDNWKTNRIPPPYKAKNVRRERLSDVTYFYSGKLTLMYPPFPQIPFYPHQNESHKEIILNHSYI